LGEKDRPSSAKEKKRRTISSKNAGESASKLRGDDDKLKQAKKKRKKTLYSRKTGAISLKKRGKEELSVPLAEGKN